MTITTRHLSPYPAPTILSEQIMMPYHADQLAQAGRPQTEAVRAASAEGSAIKPAG